MTDYEQLKAVVDYKTKRAFNEIKEMEEMREYFVKEDDKKKVEEYDDMLRTSRAVWFTYRDIQKTMDTIK